MDNKPWPPAAPDVGDAFKKACDARSKPLPGAGSGDDLAQQQQLEAAARQDRPPLPPQMHLKPRGMATHSPADPKQQARLQALRQRLKDSSNKAREDFEKTKERDM